MSLENWNAQKLDRYAEALALGLHDHECEQRERSSLCHCSKRRREAKGLTTPPAIWHHSPTCGQCHNEVTWDDGWRCYTCAVQWDTAAGDGDTGEFIDDYGDDIGGDRWGERLIVLVTGAAR